MTPGYHNRQFTSVIMHYNGSSWTQVTAPDNSGLLDVDAVSATDAWAIAADGSVLNWNGTAWTVVTSSRRATPRSPHYRRPTCGSPAWSR